MVVPTPDVTRVCVREFDSYHQFLSAWIAERQSRQPGYSFQVLANRAGLKSRSTLRQVAQGARSISTTAAASLARAMRLSEWEVDLFPGAGQLQQRQGSAGSGVDAAELGKGEVDDDASWRFD